MYKPGTSHHSTTLVVDFDDTLAITHNRNWENASPNVELIFKINELYSQGWTIHIVTARGQLSCNGNSVQADLKYRAQIEDWLKVNGVSYSSLSFEKKLAALYIDDKAITPEDFVLKFSRTPITGGLSGAKLFYDGATNAVYKTATNTASAIQWYECAQRYYYSIPAIYSVIGDTIKMQKLFPFSGNILSVLNVCYSFKNYSPIQPKGGNLKYVDRCLARVKDVLAPIIDVKLLSRILEYAEEHTPSTFSHGDFSIDNVLSNSDGSEPYLIDPINDPTLLSSWVIDIAKLYMSIGYNNPDDPRLIEIQNFAKNRGITYELLYAHEIGHLCRVYPYATTDAEKANILRLIINKIDVFRQKINK